MFLQSVVSARSPFSREFEIFRMLAIICNLLHSPSVPHHIYVSEDCLGASRVASDCKGSNYGKIYGNQGIVKGKLYVIPTISRLCIFHLFYSAGHQMLQSDRTTSSVDVLYSTRLPLFVSQSSSSIRLLSNPSIERLLQFLE